MLAKRLQAGGFAQSINAEGRASEGIASAEGACEPTVTGRMIRMWF
jgi:hypothetical protein